MSEEPELTDSAIEKPQNAAYSGNEGLSEGGHRGPGSRAKLSLEERQAIMASQRMQATDTQRIAKGRRPRGNPNLQKGVPPYCVNKISFQAWLEDHR